MPENEKKTEHWHVKIKPSLRLSARRFILDNGLQDQSDFTEKAFEHYLESQEKKIETNIEMN